MGEDKKFVGQPVLSQILDLIPGPLIQQANRKHQANRYYKKLPVRVHLVSLCMVFLAIVMAFGSYVKVCWPVKASCCT